MESGAAALENYAAQRANATKSDMQARRYLRATSLSSVQTAGPRRSKPIEAAYFVGSVGVTLHHQKNRPLVEPA